MRGLLVTTVLAAIVSLPSGAAASEPRPDRTLVAPRPVLGLALTGRAVAYVADAPRALECARIGYWHTRTRRAFTIDAREQCRDVASTGQGAWGVGIATTRLLWITYGGGNFREWTLWTATATRKTPRRLRFVSRPVEDPPPIVLGPGTEEGVPYAFDREIVYLGDNGRAIFRTTATSRVRALTTHPSRGRFAVAALLASDEIFAFGRRGGVVLRHDVPPGVRTIAFDDRRGIAYQAGSVVRYLGSEVEVPLPAGATMIDAARGRVLWTRAGDLGVTVDSGGSTRLIDGSSARPVHGQLEPAGVAWTQGRVVHWRAGMP